MDATANRALPFPELSDPPNAPAQLQALADALDLDLFFTAGLALPAFGTVGRVFLNTTDNSLHLDIGTAWITFSVGGPFLADAPGAIANPNRIAAGILTANELAANAVSNSKLQDGAVTSGKLGAASVIAGKIGAGGVSATNQLADGIVSMAKILGEATFSYTPALTGVTLGGGTRFGRYWKLGRLVVGFAGFQLGATGNVTAEISVGLPVASIAGFPGWCGARATNFHEGTYASGTGVIEESSSTITALVDVGTQRWSAAAPFDWDEDDELRVFFVYSAAA